MSPDERRFEFEGEPPDPGQLAADDERLPWPSPEWSEDLSAPVRWPSALDDELGRSLLDAFGEEPEAPAPARAHPASRLRLPVRAFVALVVVAGAATAIAIGSAGDGSPTGKQAGGPTATGKAMTSTPPPKAPSGEVRTTRAEVSDRGQGQELDPRPASEVSGPRQERQAATPPPSGTRATPRVPEPTPAAAGDPSIEFEPGPWLAE